MEEFDIVEFLRYYFKRFIYVILFTIIMVVIVNLYLAFLVKPVYDSHTTLVLARTASSDTITQNDLSLNKNLISTYIEIVKSKLILDKVNDRLHLGLTYDGLKNCVQVSSLNDTELIDIKVTYTSPDLAQSIANEIAKTFKSEISAIYNLENVSIIDEATINESPSNINHVKQSILMGMAAFIISSSVIFVIYYFDNTIKNKKEITEKLQLNVLGELPINSNISGKNELVVIKDPKSVTSETFRTIKTNLNFLAVDKPIKTILVTSSIPQEGKSFIVANLAAAYAAAGEKVLVVDCDIRKGRQNKIFNGIPSPGYTDLIVNYDSKNKLIDFASQYINRTNQKNLNVLFRGSIVPNPAELLESQKNRDVVEFLKHNYDVIIFDSAPINGHLTDSIVLSSLVDGVVVVAAEKKTPLPILKNTKEQLNRANANVLGVIINRVDSARNEKYYEYYN